MITHAEAQHLHPNHQAHFGALARKAVFEAGANGASRQTWIEVARPLTSIGFGKTLATQVGAPTAFGGALTLDSFTLAIGSDLKSIICSRADADIWIATTFKFGSLELCPNGNMPLASFDPTLERVDRLAPWIHAKTINDVPVTATLANGAFVLVSGAGGGSAAIFRGFGINVYAEEQVCQITNRLQQTSRSMGTLDSMDQVRGMYSHALGLPMATMMVQPAAQTGARYVPPRIPA